MLFQVTVAIVCALRESSRIGVPNRIVAHKSVEVDTSLLLNWISIWPPLEIWVVDPIKVIRQSRTFLEFFAGKSIQIRLCQPTAVAQNISEGIVKIPGNDGLTRIDQGCDVAAAVRMVVGVRRG